MTEDKFMTSQEWKDLSAESRHKINLYVQLAERFKKALYDCTPGIGSECIDDPEFCAQRIKTTRHNQHEMLIKKVEEYNRLVDGIKLIEATRRSGR